MCVLDFCTPVCLTSFLSPLSPFPSLFLSFPCSRSLSLSSSFASPHPPSLFPSTSLSPSPSLPTSHTNTSTILSPYFSSHSPCPYTSSDTTQWIFWMSICNYCLLLYHVQSIALCWANDLLSNHELHCNNICSHKQQYISHHYNYCVRLIARQTTEYAISSELL